MILIYIMNDNKNLEIIDSGLIRDHFAGTYLLNADHESALVEVSSAHAVEKILKTLDKLNISKEDVKYIFITHIHLDHASGAGNLMQHLPNAKLVVQPSGAKHMIDPSKLIAGANAVYGEDVVKRDYGEICSIPEERIIECKDGENFYIGDRKVTTIYTPGHARHHISIFDHKTEGMFTGDSMGLSYPEMDFNGKRFYQPTTTPTAFEYDKMLDSIDKMMGYKPKLIYFTHYGISDEPENVACQMKKRLKDYRAIVESLETFNNKEIKKLESDLETYYINECKSHNPAISEEEIARLFDIDIRLNAMGLLHWKQRSL